MKNKLVLLGRNVRFVNEEEQTFKKLDMTRRDLYYENRNLQETLSLLKRLTNLRVDPAVNPVWTFLDELFHDKIRPFFCGNYEQRKLFEKYEAVYDSLLNRLIKN